MNKWSILSTVIGLFILVTILVFLLAGWSEDALRLPIRASARIAVVLFCLAFGASSFRKFFPNSYTRWIMANRRYIGVTFAVIHLIHLFGLFILQRTFHPVFDKAATISLIGGGMAYFFVVVMLLTSFSFFRKRLPGKSWFWFHTLGGYWIWFIFIRSYGRSVIRGESLLLPVLLLLVLVFVFRKFRYIEAFKRS